MILLLIYYLTLLNNFNLYVYINAKINNGKTFLELYNINTFKKSSF